jgi:methylisocitrate lyase
MIFAEACATLDEFTAFTCALNVPVLANITEFGKTPLFTIDELRGAGIAMVLYPLSAFRAMNYVAVQVYHAIRADGTQRAAIDLMQTRQQLYEVLNYHALEEQLDRTPKS